jgi:hypothetical protein
MKEASMRHCNGTQVPGRALALAGPTVALAAETPDHLATATQLEATIALAEWQRRRDLPPSRRLAEYDDAAADRAFEARLDLVAIEMRAS